jgi:anhydro-N-acetylmuramic acid kinase
MRGPREALADADGLARLRGYRERTTHRLVGLMSGTSADGVNAALVRFVSDAGRARFTLEAARETPFDPLVRNEILHVAQEGLVAPERLMRLDVTLGEIYCDAVRDVLAAAGVEMSDVDAIGCHGQTVRHIPRHAGGGAALSLQIGSADVLAERTGCLVVSGFRGRDTAAGGEGAPLVPLADRDLFGDPAESRVLLNLGGMANLTHLPKAGAKDAVIAFDTGPGNAVIDALVRAASDGEDQFDEGGARARRGRASKALLEELLTDPFFVRPPPRSTGREAFGEAYAAKVRSIGRGLGLNDDDLIATAVQLTAASVGLAIEQFVTPRGGVDAVYLSGGGIMNPSLVAAIKRRLEPVAVRAIDALGVPAGAKEALAFAYLAHRTLAGASGNVPTATGASHDVVLGHITPGGLR